MTMESQPELTCILHVEDADSGSVVKKMDDNRWKKITETVAPRKKWLKQTKYDELLITFPENHHPHLATTAVVTRILLLSPRHYLVIPVHLKNLGTNKLGQRADPREDRHLEFW